MITDITFARDQAKRAYEENELLIGETAKAVRRALKRKLEPLLENFGEIFSGNLLEGTNVDPNEVSSIVDKLLWETGLEKRRPYIQRVLTDAIVRVDAPRGNRQLESLMNAAAPLLMWFEHHHGKPVQTVYDDNTQLNHSKAIEFLNTEFHRLLGDKISRRTQARTIIGHWRSADQGGSAHS